MPAGGEHSEDAVRPHAPWGWRAGPGGLCPVCGGFALPGHMAERRRVLIAELSLTRAGTAGPARAAESYRMKSRSSS